MQGRLIGFISTVTLMHFGMVVVGLLHASVGQMRIDEVMGSSSYGAATIAGGDGSLKPPKTELEAARLRREHCCEARRRASGFARRRTAAARG